MKIKFDDIINNEALFESIVENLYEKVIDSGREHVSQMVKGKNGIYYQKDKTPTGKISTSVKQVLKKHKKPIIAGTAAAALVGTGIYAYNRGKKKGKEKGKRQAFTTGL
jgi:hypothetical protein